MFWVVLSGLIVPDRTIINLVLSWILDLGFRYGIVRVRILSLGTIITLVRSILGLY